MSFLRRDIAGIIPSKIYLFTSDVISRICGQALTEHTLEQSMVELEQYWENREFTLRKISIPKGNGFLLPHCFFDKLFGGFYVDIKFVTR